MYYKGHRIYETDINEYTVTNNCDEIVGVRETYAEAIALIEEQDGADFYY